MRDGQTRKVDAIPAESGGLHDAFLARWQVTLVITSGPAAGTEYEIDGKHLRVGRGSHCEIVLADDAISKGHAVIEFSDSGYRVRDLGSTNGTLLNGSEVKLAELKHGDRLQVGEHAFQYLVEKRKQSPRTYVLPD